MTPTSHLWLKGDESSFSVAAPAEEIAQLIERGRDDAIELVRLETPEGRALFVDPHAVGAVREACDEQEQPRPRIGFGGMCS